MSARSYVLPRESVPAESVTGDCAARGPGGYVCTRTPGHAGEHVSHGLNVCTVWGAA